MRTFKSFLSFLPVLAVGVLATVSFPLFAQTDLSSHRLLSRTPTPTTCDRSLPECPDVATLIEIEIRDCTIEGVVYLPQSSDIDCPCYATSAPPRSASAPNWPGCGPGSNPPTCQTNPVYPACCAANPNPAFCSSTQTCQTNPTYPECCATNPPVPSNPVLCPVVCTGSFCQCNPGHSSCSAGEPPEPPEPPDPSETEMSVPNAEQLTVDVYGSEAGAAAAMVFDSDGNFLGVVNLDEALPNDLDAAIRAAIESLIAEMEAAALAAASNGGYQDGSNDHLHSDPEGWSDHHGFDDTDDGSDESTVD